MPKERVADAVRCHGQNPLNTEASHFLPPFFVFLLILDHSSHLQIREIVKRFKGPSITLAQFQEVARCNQHVVSTIKWLCTITGILALENFNLKPNLSSKNI